MQRRHCLGCLASLAVTLGLLSCVTAARPASQDEAAADGCYATSIVGRDGVKVRKMYLVRPDLIPYHMQFDVYC